MQQFIVGVLLGAAFILGVMAIDSCKDQPNGKAGQACYPNHTCDEGFACAPPRVESAEYWMCVPTAPPR